MRNVKTEGDQLVQDHQPHVGQQRFFPKNDYIDVADQQGAVKNLLNTEQNDAGGPPLGGRLYVNKRNGTPSPMTDQSSCL